MLFNATTRCPGLVKRVLSTVPDTNRKIVAGSTNFVSKYDLVANYILSGGSKSYQILNKVSSYVMNNSCP